MLNLEIAMNSIKCSFPHGRRRQGDLTTGPLAVLLAIVTGSAVSLAVGLLMTGAVLLFMTDKAARFVTEKGPLLQAILLFTLLSAVSGLALYGELRARRWRFGAMAAMVAMLGVTVWVYWPRG